MSRQRDATVGHAVMSLVAAYGVDTVFGIPGTHNLELYRPLPALGIRAVTTRHEQGAGYAADGWSRRTGRPGVVVTTSGPGLLNALAAAANAYAESRAVLFLSPGPRRGEERGHGGLHETKDQSAAAAAVMRWSRRVLTENEAVEAVHDAFAAFAAARPQPVHIEVPLDLLESATTIADDRLQARPRPPRRAADPASVQSAAALLNSATSPMILAGGGAVDATAQLLAVAETLASPVVTTINGKAAIPESHPLSLGSELRLRTTAAALNAADVLLVVGSKCGRAELWDNVLSGPTVIRIDIDDTAWHGAGGDARRDAGTTAPLLGDDRTATHPLGGPGGALRLLGDADATLADLRTLLEPRPPCTADALDALRAAQRAEVRELAPALTDLAERIRDALPADAVLAGDSSQIVYHALTSVLRQEAPRSFLYMATFATLGYALPAAIGARLASDDRPVVCITGDGALMSCLQELMTAVECGIDLTVVCIDNGGYGEIRQNQLDRGIPPLGVDLAQPDWPALASAFGARAVSVRWPEVTAALSEAIARPGVQFVHVRYPKGSTSPTPTG